MYTRQHKHFNILLYGIEVLYYIHLLCEEIFFGGRSRMSSTALPPSSLITTNPSILSVPISEKLTKTNYPM
jgi:hypothetical protein